jgi:hypothetical protein
MRAATLGRHFLGRDSYTRFFTDVNGEIGRNDPRGGSTCEPFMQ